MAKHNVYVNLPWRELGKADAQFEIYQNGKKLGTITISRGAIEYSPKKARKAYKMVWGEFDKIIEKHYENK